MCRASKVLCVAEGQERLTALKAATASAGWELAPGASDEASAIGQVDSERPHVLVAFGDFGRLVGLVRERFPAMMIVTDRDAPGADAVATSLEEVRGLIEGLPRPGGPVL